jgi:thioredoxin 1
MTVLALSDEEELGQAVDLHDIVMIDFWAPRCSPCKGFMPILEKASERHPDIAFFRVNTDENRDLAKAFDVESIPTLVAIRDRIMVAAQGGMLPEDVLEDLISNVKGLDMDELRREMSEPDE